MLLHEKISRGKINSLVKQQRTEQVLWVADANILKMIGEEPEVQMKRVRKEQHGKPG